MSCPESSITDPGRDPIATLGMAWAGVLCITSAALPLLSKFVSDAYHEVVLIVVIDAGTLHDLESTLYVFSGEVDHTPP